MTATWRSGLPACAAPCATPIPAPMQPQVWMALSGGDQAQGVAADVAVDRHLELVQHVERRRGAGSRGRGPAAAPGSRPPPPDPQRHMRPTRAAARPGSHSRAPRRSNSPFSGKMLLPSQGMPISWTASSMNGSSSSTTISRSTEAAKSWIRFSRQRPGHAELQHRGGRENLFDVLVGHAAGDDAERPIARFDPVEWASFGDTRPQPGYAPQSPDGV